MSEAIYNPWRGEEWLIRDTPAWQQKYPTGPVHFDVKCLLHNKEYLEIASKELPSSPEEFRKLFVCCYG